jgi:hypothetical protein
MTTIVRIRTDYEARLHVEQDTDAPELNCFCVTLPPYTPTSWPMLVYREGADMNALWADALAMVAHLKAQPWKLVAPPNVFQPFGVITARNVEEVRREFEYRRELMMAHQFQTDPAYRERVEADPILHEDGRAHEQRVASLIRALDLMDGAPLPVAAPWLPFKALN